MISAFIIIIIININSIKMTFNRISHIALLAIVLLACYAIDAKPHPVKNTKQLDTAIKYVYSSDVIKKMMMIIMYDDDDDDADAESFI